jgi:membrane associated rhomboid family serine protease
MFIFLRYEIGVGASGAIFGLMGLETVSMVLRYKGISFQRFLLFIGIIGTAFLSLFENNNL